MKPGAPGSGRAGPMLILGVAALFAGLASQAEEEAAHADVAVSVAPIIRRDLHAFLTVYGSVEAEPARGGKPPASALVAAPSPGLVTESRCEEGQKVVQGQVLFGLDHRLADVQVERAQTVVTLAERNLKRKLSLKQTENVSQKLLDEADQQLAAARKDLDLAQTQRALLMVQSPLKGTVVRINVRPGEVVSGNAPLAEVVDLDRLVVNTQVPAAEAMALRAGQPAALFAGTDPASGEAAPSALGTVSFLGLQVDPRSATVPIRIALPAGSGLRPGQFVQVRVTTETHPAGLAVPLESLVRVRERPAVFLREGDWARLRWVQMGLVDGEYAEVSGEGLHEGLEVLTTGAYGLTEDTRIHLGQP